MIFNKITPKLLRKVGRKTTFFMLQCVKNNCKGGNCMRATRRIYLDNIRWITVCIVVVYHVIYMFNGVQRIWSYRTVSGTAVAGCVSVSGVSVVMACCCLWYPVWQPSIIWRGHDTKAFIRDKTRKLHFPVFDGCNHMQYQIRGPKGFAGMLEKMPQGEQITGLPFVI